MARRIFPNEESRLVYGYTNPNAELVSKAGATVEVFVDAAGAFAANILTEAGASIPGGVLTVGADSKIPYFQGPDGVPYGADLLYYRVQGSSVIEKIFARYDDRLDVDQIVKCTAATHPTIGANDVIYESDTKKFLANNGSGTLITPKKKYEPDVQEVTSNSAAVSAETTLVTSSTIAADGVTKFDIEGAWQALTSTIATDVHALRLYDGGNMLMQINRYASATTAGAGDGGSIKRTGVQLSAGNHTLTLRVVRVSGTGTVQVLASATSPMSLVVRESS